MPEKLLGGNINQVRGNKKFSFLNENQIRMIDDALSTLGKFGEVRLVVEKGILRYIVTQNSVDVFKYNVGDFREKEKGE